MASTHLPDDMSDAERLAYFKKAARNMELNDYKKEKYISAHEELLADISECAGSRGAYYDTYSDEFCEIIVGRYIMRIRDEVLARAVDSLHINKKEVIAKSFFYDIPDKQIANELGISCEALRKRKSRIYEELRQLYGGLR